MPRAPRVGPPRKASANSRFPTDPADAERLRWVAHYAVLGWQPARIAQALRLHLPGTAFDTAQMSADLRRLHTIWRAQALGDADAVFSKLSARFDHLAGSALEEYRASMVPRTVVVGSDRVTLPAASQAERTALLNTAIRATAAQAMLHFGKGGSSLTVNVDARRQTMQITPAAEAGLALREQAAEMRRLIAADPASPKRPKYTGPPQHTADAPDRAFQADIEAVVRSQGRTGATADWQDDS